MVARDPTGREVTQQIIKDTNMKKLIFTAFIVMAVSGYAAKPSIGITNPDLLRMHICRPR